MTNGFFNAFDTAPLGPPAPRRADYRTPFQINRDRILYSSALRCLQSKTQVFVSGEYALYRVRLTHSLEGAQIGRFVCALLRAARRRLLRRSEQIRERPGQRSDRPHGAPSRRREHRLHLRLHHPHRPHRRRHVHQQDDRLPQAFREDQRRDHRLPRAGGGLLHLHGRHRRPRRFFTVAHEHDSAATAFLVIALLNSFSCLVNTLFFRPNCRTLYGDTKATVTALA